VAPKWIYRIAPVMQRWGNNAPAVCCGVCKPCMTQAATGAIVAATGLSLEGLALRRQGGVESSSSASASTRPAMSSRMARTSFSGCPAGSFKSQSM
jgi:hypothetical protein